MGSHNADLPQFSVVVTNDLPSACVTYQHARSHNVVENISVCDFVGKTVTEGFYGIAFLTQGVIFLFDHTLGVILQTVPECIPFLSYFR